MDSLFSELCGFSSLFVWSLLPPILMPFVAKIYGAIQRRFNPSFDTQLRDVNLHRRRCRVATLTIVMLGILVKTIYTHQSSIFLKMGFKSGCLDPNIKTEYRKFLKAFHPDKIGAVSDEFVQQKLLFDAIKDEDKCIKYDIFGNFNIGDKTIDRTEKECTEHYFMETLMFYMASFVMFFGFSIFKDMESSIEPMLIFITAAIVDLDGVVFYRNRIAGKILALLSNVFGVVSIFEFRAFVRSLLFNILIYIRHVKQAYTKPKLTPSEKQTLLMSMRHKCDVIMEKLNH